MEDIRNRVILQHLSNNSQIISFIAEFCPREVGLTDKVSCTVMEDCLECWNRALENYKEGKNNDKR